MEKETAINLFIKQHYCKEKCWDEVGLSHHCLGNLEIRIKSAEDLEKSKPFILKKYEMS